MLWAFIVAVMTLYAVGLQCDYIPQPFGCDGEMVIEYENFIRNQVMTDYEYQRFQQWWYERQVESGTWYGSLPYDANAEYVFIKQLMEGK